jgi:hypothetical protein
LAAGEFLMAPRHAATSSQRPDADRPGPGVESARASKKRQL